MKICYISSIPEIPERHKSLFSALGELKMIAADRLSDEELIPQMLDTEILIAAPSGIRIITSLTFDKLKKLKFLTTTTTGTDWIDLKSAAEHGVIVKNCKGANAQSVAEHTWAIILDLSKRVSEFDRDARFKEASDFKKYIGREVYGKTLGVLGLGDIGSRVAQIASAFNMQVLGFTRSPKNLPGVKETTLAELLRKSDIISICLPLTEETKNLISTKEIEMMKDNVVLVNTAREEITNKKAVLSGLSSGKIFGFGIETKILKPVPADDPYFSFPNVLLNPHNAFNTVDANERVKDMWVQNVVDFVKTNS